jgi:hypothetical protein
MTITPKRDSAGRAVENIYQAPVNNAILDPMQGFDADVWVIDQATGEYYLVGRFTSIQITVRNATEPYLELNQRVPRYLDGEFQIGWTLERGMLDARVLQHTFGYGNISRELRLSRGSRMQITFEIDAPELHQTAGVDLGLAPDGTMAKGDKGFRVARGQMVLTFCKVDTFTMSAMAGRQVIANQWQGLAEGITAVPNQSIIWAGTTLGQGVDAVTALQKAKNEEQQIPGTQMPEIFSQSPVTRTNSSSPEPERSRNSVSIGGGSTVSVGGVTVQTGGGFTIETN